MNPKHAAAYIDGRLWALSSKLATSNPVTPIRPAKENVLDNGPMRVSDQRSVLNIPGGPVKPGGGIAAGKMPMGKPFTPQVKPK